MLHLSSFSAVLRVLCDLCGCISSDRSPSFIFHTSHKQAAPTELVCSLIVDCYKQRAPTELRPVHRQPALIAYKGLRIHDPFKREPDKVWSRDSRLWTPDS